MVRLDRGDHVIDRPPLERVHGRGPARSIWRSCGSPAFMSSVRPSSSRNITGPPLAAVTSAVWLLTTQSRHRCGARGCDRRRRARCPRPGCDHGAAPASADLGGLPEHQAVLAAVEQHCAAPVVDADDAPLVVLLDAEPPVGAVEGDDIARRIVPRERRSSSRPRAPPSRVAPAGAREVRRIRVDCGLHRPTPERWYG